jgi:transposase-like protein
MSDRIMNSRTTRRRLAPSEKYEMFVSVLTGQATQREAAAKWQVDRPAVVHVCRVARQGALDALAASVPGRPGQSGCEAALARALAGIERLRATVTGQAVALHLHEGKAAWD